MLIGELIESKQVGILYHYTSITALKKIVQDFILKDADHNRGYVSFTRSGTGIQGKGQNDCRLVLNGNKMSNNIKIAPDSLAKKDGKIVTDSDNTPMYKPSTKKQAEERIYQSEIKIKPYLIQIDLLIHDFSDIDQKDIEFIKKHYNRVNVVKKFIPVK